MSLTPAMQSAICPARIEPFLKWPGGKAGELDKILPAAPTIINRYFEPFLGGAAVFLALPHEGPAFLNDKSPDLMAFYRSVASGDAEFFSTLRHISRDWAAIQTLVARHAALFASLYVKHAQHHVAKPEISAALDRWLAISATELAGLFASNPQYGPDNFRSELMRNLTGKLARMRGVESVRGKLPPKDVINNIESAVKSAYYMHLRHLYNRAASYSISNGLRAAVFFFIREYAYAAMFHFNKQGHFNVPYGGITYNHKAMDTKIERMVSAKTRRKLAQAVLTNLDFSDFFRLHEPSPGDFVFVDPPYDSDFSDYDGSSFGRKDQVRLAEYLLNDCHANFMVVIKNTDYISSLYSDSRLSIHYFDKKYMWTIKERNNRDVTHIMITNY